MTVYTEIPDDQIEPEKPGTSVLINSLRDNPIAIAEGSAGAPKIQTAAYQDFSVTPQKLSMSANTNWTSGTLITLFSLVGPIVSGSVPPSKTAIYYVSNGTGTIRYDFDLRTDTNGRLVIAELYKNGVLLQSFTSSSIGFATKTGTIDVSIGDEIHVRLGEDGGLSSNGEIQNFILRCNY